jgi:multiple sugar transport system substrate-binding protein
MFRKLSQYVLMILLVVSLAACANGGQQNGQKSADAVKDTSQGGKVKQEPVELKFYNTNKIYSSEEFQKYFFEPAQKKFPNIKFVFIPTNNKINPEMDGMVASGDIPDLIMGSNGDGNLALETRNLQMDLTSLVKKHNYNLNQLAPAYLQLTHAISDGKIYGLPIYAGGAPVYYNQDIFDKFGVPYPKGQLTWDDFYELSRKLAREDNGTQYYGLLLDPATVIHMNNLSLPLLDATGKKPAFNTDGWKNYLQMLDKFYHFPGYALKAGNVTTAGVQSLFNKDKTLAMWVTSQLLAGAKLEGLEHWDITPYPTSKEKPGVGQQPYAFFTFVASTSKHPDEAFQVISYWASDEYQMMMSKLAEFKPVSGSSAVQSAFGQESPLYRGKNISAFFTTKNADLAPAMFTKYHNVAKSALIKVLTNSLAIEKKDVNTALREAEETAVKTIQEQEATN